MSKAEETILRNDLADAICPANRMTGLLTVDKLWPILERVMQGANDDRKRIFDEGVEYAKRLINCRREIADLRADIERHKVRADNLRERALAAEAKLQHLDNQYVIQSETIDDLRALIDINEAKLQPSPCGVSGHWAVDWVRKYPLCDALCNDPETEFPEDSHCLACQREAIGEGR